MLLNFELYYIHDQLNSAFKKLVITSSDAGREKKNRRQKRKTKQEEHDADAQ